jgi:hypothetical protein
MHPWLARLRHDLVKRAAWPARDLCELLESGSPALPPDLRALRAGLFELHAADGSRCDARALWAALLLEAPKELLARERSSLDEFAAAIEAAMAAVDRAVPQALGAAAARGARAACKTAAGAAPKAEPSKRVFDAAIESVLALQRLFDQLAQRDAMNPN